MSPLRGNRHRRAAAAAGGGGRVPLLLLLIAAALWTKPAGSLTLLPPVLESLCEPCLDAASCSIGATFDFDGGNRAGASQEAQAQLLRGRGREPTLLFPSTPLGGRGPAGAALQALVELFANDTAVEQLVGNFTVQWSRESAHIVKNRGEGGRSARLRDVVGSAAAAAIAAVSGQETTTAAAVGNGAVGGGDDGSNDAQQWYVFDRDHFFPQLRAQRGPAHPLLAALDRAFFSQPLLAPLPAGAAALGVDVAGFVFDAAVAAAPAQYLFVGPGGFRGGGGANGRDATGDGRNADGGGGGGSGVGFHAHAESSALLLRGRKLWFLYSEEQVQARPGLLAHQSHPGGTARWVKRVLPRLPAADRPRCFVQRAGTVLHLPEGWHHATLNLAPDPPASSSSNASSAAAASPQSLAAAVRSPFSSLVVAVGNQRKLASRGSLLLFLSAAQQLMTDDAGGGGGGGSGGGGSSAADALEVLRAASRAHPETAAPIVGMGNVLLRANMIPDARDFFAAALQKPRGWRREEARKGLCKVELHAAIVAGFDAVGVVEADGRRRRDAGAVAAVRAALRRAGPHCRALLRFDPWDVETRLLWAEFSGLWEVWGDGAGGNNDNDDAGDGGSTDAAGVGATTGQQQQAREMEVDGRGGVRLPPPAFAGLPGRAQFELLRAADPEDLDVLQKFANFALTVATLGRPEAGVAPDEAEQQKRRAQSTGSGGGRGGGGGGSHSSSSSSSDRSSDRSRTSGGAGGDGGDAGSGVLPALTLKRRDAALTGELLRELVSRDPSKAPLAAAMLASLSTELLAQQADEAAVREGLGYLGAAAALHPARFEPMLAQLMHSFQGGVGGIGGGGG